MAFKKGQSGNKNGRPVGTVSEKTLAWEHLGNFITESGAERVKEILATCNADKFMLYYPMLLEYFKPKLARTENKNESDVKVSGGLTLNVINPNDIDKINNL